jgi:hypothetical protein
MQGISANVPSDRSIAVIVNVVTRVIVTGFYLFVIAVGTAKQEQSPGRESTAETQPDSNRLCRDSQRLFPNASLGGLMP